MAPSFPAAKAEMNTSGSSARVAPTVGNNAPISMENRNRLQARSHRCLDLADRGVVNGIRFSAGNPWIAVVNLGSTGYGGFAANQSP